MVIFPKAKINIGLRITGKRPDGFHNIETIFYPVNLSDAIEFVVVDRNSKSDLLQVTGVYSETDPFNNLVMKAVRNIRKIADIPFLRLHLHKAIPAGAGLGGGSSDAATLLKSLNRHFNLGISTGKLMEIALELGSDCPFFIDGIPAFAGGRGELLTPVKPVQEGLHLLMVNPGIHINTGEAFRNCTPEKPDSELMDFYNRDISEWKNLIINDFEGYIFSKHPDMKVIKDSLYNMGAIYSSMSGSGSTIYGIFRSKPEVPEILRRHVIYSDIF